MPYQDWQANTLAPPWLRGKNARALTGTFGMAKDQVADAARQAVKASFIDLAPDDALAYGGPETNLERYPGESNDQYRARIAGAWETWETSATAPGVVAALGAAGFPNAALYTTRAAPPGYVGAWPNAAMAASGWSRFWIVLQPPFPFPWVARRWGDVNPATGHAYRWGELGPDGTPYTWGSTATGAQVAFVRRVIRKWKSSHLRCAEIWVVLDDTHTVRWPGV